jgi:hypothetical protein
MTLYDGSIDYFNSEHRTSKHFASPYFKPCNSPSQAMPLRSPIERRRNASRRRREHDTVHPNLPKTCMFTMSKGLGYLSQDRRLYVFCFPVQHGIVVDLWFTAISVI